MKGSVPVHELAHIRRRDHLVNLGRLAVQALLLFHPFVWWISRQIRIEREACCNDAGDGRRGGVFLCAGGPRGTLSWCPCRRRVRRGRSAVDPSPTYPTTADSVSQAGFLDELVPRLDCVGIAAGADGDMLIIHNNSGQSMNIAHDSGTDPTAANRICTMTGSDISSTTRCAAWLIYEDTIHRWLLVNFQD